MMSMPTYSVSREDADQVRAILLTHAEMQDRQSMRAEESKCIAHPEDVASYQEEIDQLGVDCDNLKRIADIFI